MSPTCSISSTDNEVLMDGVCPNGASWSSWTNHHGSQNSSYTHESEYFESACGGFLKENYQGTPFAVQTKVNGVKFPFNHTSDVAKQIEIGYSLACPDQSGGQCKDFQIRFCCYNGELH